MKIVNRAKELRKQLFEEITVFEYVLWWVARIMLLCAVIFAKDNAYRTLDSLNMLTAYAMTALRFVAPKKSFFARIDFRCQHLINLMEVLGIFFGHLLFVYDRIPKFDRLLHLLSGPVVVIAGYYIYKAFVTKDQKEKYCTNPVIATYCSFSFSFVIMVLWEIQEFISDYFIGSQNQGYYYVPPQDDIWFKIFGQGANGGVGQFPLWDTMLDMIDATITTIPAALVLFAVLVLIKKKHEKAEAEKELIYAQ